MITVIFSRVVDHVGKTACRVYKAVLNSPLQTVCQATSVLNV